MFARYIISSFVLLALFSSQACAQAGGEALMKFCKPDVERLCAGVQPGGGRIIKCLKGHKEEMSVGCAQALMKIKSEAGK